jgi:hypothetical protein
VFIFHGKQKKKYANIDLLNIIIFIFIIVLHFELKHFHMQENFKLYFVVFISKLSMFIMWKVEEYTEATADQRLKITHTSVPQRNPIDVNVMKVILTFKYNTFSSLQSFK